MTKSNQDLAQAYKRFCGELSRLLYEEDPAGMGKSIGAPPDEYDGEAERLAVALRNLTSRDEIEKLMHQEFHTTSGPLVDRVAQAVTKFRWRTSR